MANESLFGDVLGAPLPDIDAVIADKAPPPPIKAKRRMSGEQNGQEKPLGEESPEKSEGTPGNDSQLGVEHGGNLPPSFVPSNDLPDTENVEHWERLAKELMREPDIIAGERVPVERAERTPTVGETLSATFQRQNTLAQGFDKAQAFLADTDDSEEPDFHPLQAAPPQYVRDYADLYVNAKNQRQIDAVTDDISESLRLKSIQDRAPWYQDIAASLISDLIDPINWIFPGTLAASRAERMAVYLANTPRAQAIIKGAVTGSAGAVVSTIAQETVLQNLDNTRAVDESVFNVIGATVLGAAIGGAFGSMAKGAQEAAKADIADIYKSGTALPSIPNDSAGSMRVNPEAKHKAEELAFLPKWLRKIAKLTPYYQMVNGDFLATKELANELNQTHQFLGKNIGVETDEGDIFRQRTQVSVEEHMRSDQRFLLKTTTKYEDARNEWLGISKGPLSGFKGDRNKRKQEYDLAVDEGMINDYYSADPAVQKGINVMRSGLEQLSKAAKEAGLLPEADIIPKNAKSYWPVVWNVPKITENYRAFTQFLYENFKKMNDEIRALTPELRSLKKQLKEQGLSKEDYEKAIAESIPKHLKGRNGKIRKLHKDDDFIYASTDKTIKNITGSEAARMQNPLFKEYNSASPLKERGVTIDHSLIMPWTIRDPIRILNQYYKALSPLVRMTQRAKQFGYKSITDWKNGVHKKLEDEYNDMLARTPDGKSQVELDKKYKKQAELINTSFDIQLGIYGQGQNIFTGKWANFARRTSEWNYMRLLGFVLPSSLPDVGVVAIRNGVFRTIYSPIKQLLGNFESIKNNKETVQHLGFALNSRLGWLQKSFMDNEGLTNETGVFGKVWDRAVQSFGNVSLVNFWDDFWQTTAGIESISRTLSGVRQWVETGKISETEQRRFLSLHIDKQQAEQIYKQWQKIGGEDNGGYWLDITQFTTDTAEELDAYDAFKFSIAKDIEWCKVAPTQQDKTIAHYNNGGKLILQMKTFMFASTNKVLLSGIQRREELELYTGAMAALGMGAMGYVLTSYLHGNSPDLSFERLSKEAIDRSGLLGILMEPYNIAAKIQALPWQATSRYQSRGKIGAFLGPTVGLADDILEIFSDVATANGGKRLSKSDVNRIIRLMPYQNLFYLYKLNQIVAHGGARAIGIER